MGERYTAIRVENSLLEQQARAREFFRGQHCSRVAEPYVVYTCIYE